MKDIFAVYSAMLVLVFAAANYKGYALESLFVAGRHVGAQQNHYHK